MKPAPLITRINESDILKEDIERTDRNIIQSILSQFKIDKHIFSVNNLNTRLVCIFQKLKSIRFETLQKIYLLSDKIKVINILFPSKSLEVQIYKNNTEKKNVKIRKRPNIKEIDLCAMKFIEASNVHKSDRRVCVEIVKLLYKWTFGTVACKVQMDLFGDTYHCKIFKLRTISFQQLNSLTKLSDLINDIEIDYIQKMLSFKVTRTNEYITLNELNSRKKQKI